MTERNNGKFIADVYSYSFIQNFAGAKKKTRENIENRGGILFV
jgi:hypothetical protein